MKHLGIIIACIISVAFARGPRFENVKPDVGYHAIARENGRNVEVSPRIRVVDDEVCSFTITNKHHGEIPFMVQITDKALGEAKLVAKKELNCEKRKAFKFDIAAVGCDGLSSENVTVHLTVEDINEFAPEFVQETYSADVDEDRLYDKIVQVEADDNDCSAKFSDICKYEILTNDQPFTIDQEGRIKNTEPLSWENAPNHILTVVAYDCGMKRSKPHSQHQSEQSLQDWMERGSGTHRRVATKVTLATRHIGKGCDRDTYSVESQRKLCGASSDSVDLLPSPGIGAEWTRGLPTDDGHESDQIYEFDGTSNAVVIPESTLNHNLTDNFTVAFWMKHEPYPDHNDTHMKEHIICNADDHKMNRHHYSIFVRNCRLILLLRREFYQERPSVFRPAEWRWKMPEVCDNQWHHYAVSVNFPEANLYVDGQLFKIQTNNPDIVDDWPLHPAKDINTTFVVGACWQGKDEKMAFNFHGFLAGLSVLRGRTESAEVLACLHRCKEGLEVPPADLLEPGMELLTNSDLSEVTVEGNSKTNLEDLISRVGYVNSREFPTPGRRSVQLSTTVTCAKGKTVKVPPVEAYIMVLQPELPSITINGTPNLAREYEAFKQGIQLFASVSVLVSQDEEMHEGLNSLDHKLDSCSVQVYPPLNPDHEYFKLPISLMTHLGIHHKENKDGLVIFGADTIHNYDLILRQIVYYNRKPAYYLNRAFKLVCSELNGRFVSNEYIQTLTVIHPRAEPGHEAEPKPALEPVNHAQVHDHKVEFKEAKVRAAEFMDNELGGGTEAIAKTSASHAVAIILLSRETRDEDQEMAWDDSSLTIIVNPMDQIEQEQAARPLNEEEDSDSSDDGSSYRDDGESSEEEEDAGTAGKAKTKELEWDDSTLNF
ncbi:Calsyntenin-1 like protein [Argiope bruennichi]|uniref:Calsyntenin-1 like protein n=1 Tax=Argiope bruennichi TaxID=94029 RepID=A0A8T0EET5_ARGBR|nr:Calsyntenin-1 like protein [Argiope bruennichi]